jgi:hypothetical protein
VQDDKCAEASPWAVTVSYPQAPLRAVPEKQTLKQGFGVSGDPRKLEE